MPGEERGSRDYGEPRARVSAEPVSAPAKKKSRFGWLKVTAVCLAVLLLCGAVGVGGVAAWSGMRNMLRGRAETSAPTGTVAEDQTRETAGTDGTGGTEDETAPILGLRTFAEESGAMTASEVYARYVDSVVAIRTESTSVNIFGQTTRTASAGTGFIITEDGYILTNNHVVSGASSVTVTLNNGDEYEAAVLGSDSASEVAVVKIEATGLSPVNLGDSDDIAVGEDVVIIGNPLGELTNSLSKGVVSALDRNVTISTGVTINAFQIDASVNSGNSGGPVFDATGRVIGIVTAKYAASTYEGLGFAIPINDAVKAAEELIAHGYISTGTPVMNIIVRTLDEATAAYYDVPEGAYVWEITAGGCADRAGMEEGDIITDFDGVTITNKEELNEAKSAYAPGDTVTVTVYRDGSYLALQVTLDEEGAPIPQESIPFDPFGGR